MLGSDWGDGLMSYIYYNPNPVKNNTRDCAIRAVAKALGISWEKSFGMIASMAYQMGETMDANAVWGAVLRQNGFYREIIPNTCPDCYTADDFCQDFNKGVYVLGFDNHTATVIDGNLYDSFDSSALIPIYYWSKKGE